MNYLDTFDASKRWQSRLHPKNDESRGKRFSMNYLDSLDHPALAKRFSMNFMDSLDSKKSKRFSMNFRDTLTADESRSGIWGNPEKSSSDINKKRSDEKAAVDKTMAEIQNLDFLISLAAKKYGLIKICQQPAWKELIDFNIFLKELLKSGKPDMYIKLTPGYNCHFS